MHSTPGGIGFQKKYIFSRLQTRILTWEGSQKTHPANPKIQDIRNIIASRFLTSGRTPKETPPGTIGSIEFVIFVKPRSPRSHRLHEAPIATEPPKKPAIKPTKHLWALSRTFAKLQNGLFWTQPKALPADRRLLSRKILFIGW